MNQSFFVIENIFFHNFSLTFLVTQGKCHVDDKKLLMRKSSQLHFHNCQEKFSSQWGLLDNWGNRARRLLTVEKEEASTFQAADLATTVADMLAESYC